MTITLKEVFDEIFKDFKFDSQFGKRVYKYQIGYINQNKEHIEFFGSNLLGVNVVRFKDTDVIKFFDDVLDLDYYEVTEKIRTVTTIDHSYIIAGDPLNLTLFYLLHRSMTSRYMSDSQKKRAAYDTALIFFYRSIAAVMSYYFRYPADPKIAQAAYAELNNKYLIKKLGSWHKVMDYRADDLIGKQSIHHKNLLEFMSDSAIVYAIEDSQGRIKDIVKNYCQEFYKVRGEGGTIATTTSTYLDAEGEETTREKTHSPEKVVTYLRNTISDKGSFVKDDLINVILKINSNTSYRIVKASLVWLSEHSNDSNYHKLIDDFISLTLVQSIFFIDNYIEVNKRRDYAHVLTSLKNLYLSTRSVDPELMKIRDQGSKVIKATGIKMGNSLALSTRTSLILYITLRAITGQSN